MKVNGLTVNDYIEDQNNSMKRSILTLACLTLAEYCNISQLIQYRFFVMFSYEKCLHNYLIIPFLIVVTFIGPATNTCIAKNEDL